MANEILPDILQLVPAIDPVLNLRKAISDAVPGASLFCFAACCPDRLLDCHLLQLCRDKQLNVYLETPNTRDFQFHPCPANWRCLVCQDFGDLKQYSILTAQGFPLAPVARHIEKPILALGQFAGYRKLAFETPRKLYPLLYQHPDYAGILIAGIPLSQCLQGRFAPMADWVLLWKEIFRRIAPHIQLPAFQATLHTAWEREDILPEQAGNDCLKELFGFLESSILYREDGCLKVAEGFSSRIAADGSQLWRASERSDCVVEVAAAFAINAILEKQTRYAEMAEEIIARILCDPAQRALSPQDPCTGQFSFYDNVPVYYSSGNAKCALLLACAQNLAPDTDQRAREILRIMLSLLRTTGKNGMRRSSFVVPDSFYEHNWDYFAGENWINLSPHRQAALWSLFLAAWKLTGYRPFLEKASSGIEMLMETYPDVEWTNGYSAELAKMLQPLAFLCRIEPTQRHQQWLNLVCQDLIDRMDDCGAVRETLGNPARGMYPPPASNDAYGKSEASLIQKDGDPCCDLLYTQVFAFAGMHEAWLACHKPEYLHARNKMEEFLIRTRIVSASHPQFNGAWMRAFDFKLWEYWGSSADRDWGAWCIESGWINAPAAIAFTLKNSGQGLFDLLPPDNAWSSFLDEMREELQTVSPVDKNSPKAQRAILGNEN